MTDPYYTLEEIKEYLRKYAPDEETVGEWLNMPYIMFGGECAMDLLNSKEDDYSADVMGSFKRMFG